MIAVQSCSHLVVTPSCLIIHSVTTMRTRSLALCFDSCMLNAFVHHSIAGSPWWPSLTPSEDRNAHSWLPCPSHLSVGMHAAISLEAAMLAASTSVCSTSCFMQIWVVNSTINSRGFRTSVLHTHCTWSDNSHHSEEAVAILELWAYINMYSSCTAV